MNKTDFIRAVAKRQGITFRKASREINDVMDSLRVILSSGEDVQLGGFGTFDVLTDLMGERIPVFKGGKALRRALNTIKGE